MTSAPGPETVDHLVYTAPRLESGIEAIRSLLGVEPVAGGRHPRWRTHNALVGLGPATYLEIISGHGEGVGRRPFGIDGLTAPRLAGWAAGASPLEPVVEAARAAGIDLGSVMGGSREADDGRVLRWRLTDPSTDRDGGTLPFLIDWGDSPHPAKSLHHPCALDFLRIRHPDADRIRPFLGPLHPRVHVEAGEKPVLSAALETPVGRVILE